MKSSKLYPQFRKIALAEGISYLILLLIAMPLKYFASLPIAVTIVGALHGVLFVAFIIYAYLIKDKYDKSLGWVVKAFIASILPFGTFVADKEWKREEQTILNSIQH